MKPTLFILFLFAALAFSACRPCDDPTDPECPNYCDDWTNPDCHNYCVDETDRDCPNYDPCWDQIPVTADFWIIEDGSFGAAFIVTDTVYYDTVRPVNISTQVKIEHPDWTYTWDIGAGEYTGPRTGLDYTHAPRRQPLSITLMVAGPPNKTCFPDDDGRDTMTQYIVVKEDSFFRSVSFFGYLNENPEDTITLGFRPGSELMYNFSPGCDSSYWGGAGTFRSLTFIGEDECDLAWGTIQRDPARIGDFDSVRIDYTTTAGSISQPKPMQFNGRRIGP